MNFPVEPENEQTQNRQKILDTISLGKKNNILRNSVAISVWLFPAVLFKVCEENLASQKYISEKGNNSSTALSDNYGYASILDQNLGSGRCLKVDFNMESENRLL